MNDSSGFFPPSIFQIQIFLKWESSNSIHGYDQGKEASKGVLRR